MCVTMHHINGMVHTCPIIFAHGVSIGVHMHPRPILCVGFVFFRYRHVTFVWFVVYIIVSLAMNPLTCLICASSGDFLCIPLCSIIDVDCALF